MPRLFIDSSHRTSRLSGRRGSREFAGQNAELHLVLALARMASPPEAAAVTAEALHRVGHWKWKAFGSVGKEVSDHLVKLRRLGWPELIASLPREKTKRWRLTLKASEITFLPSREACQRWVAEERDRMEHLDEAPAATMPWLQAVSAALIELQRGELPNSLLLAIEARRAAEGPLLRAIAELVELRVKARLGEFPERSEDLEGARTPVLKGIRARAEIAQALDPRSGREDTLEDLQARIRELKDDLPDVNGLGHAYNASGVLYRRSGDFETAARYFREAAALLAASTDLPTLAATVYNFGVTLYEVARDERTLAAAGDAILLARSFQERLNIGRDFAFGEVLLGLIELHRGNVPSAQSWLEEARRTVEDTTSTQSFAAVKALEARVAWARAFVADDVPAQRGTIRELYAEALRLRREQNQDTADLEEDVGRLASLLPPPWFEKMPAAKTRRTGRKPVGHRSASSVRRR